MNENLYRDRLVLPALDAIMRMRRDKPFDDLLVALVAGFRPPQELATGLRAAIALALDFWTWRRLSGEGMADGEAAALMVGAVKTAARG